MTESPSCPEKPRHFLSLRAEPFPSRNVVLTKQKPMFGLFKKSSPVEKLQKKYEALMEESHRLSKTDRKAGDAKFAEAQELLREIEALETK